VVQSGNPGLAHRAAEISRRRNLRGDRPPVEHGTRREAVEEANCAIQDIVPICDYFVSPGGTSECISLFCGKVDAASVGGVCGLEEEAEDISVIVVPFPEAIAQLQAGNIRSAAPIIALQWLQLNHDQIRARWGVVS